ncbi:MAG: hemerythrin domain-containing protein [Rhizobacter sp.]
MPTTAKPARKPAAKLPATSRAPDALKLLMTDHKEVKAMFRAYEKLVNAEAGDEEKQALAQEICEALTAHATVEEELLYPAAREVLAEGDLVDEATVEHAGAKDLIAQIEGMQPSDDLYDAKVKVLGEYINHHVKEEETEMFPKLRKSELDLKELGASIKSRKQELLAEIEASAAH